MVASASVVAGTRSPRRRQSPTTMEATMKRRQQDERWRAARARWIIRRDHRRAALLARMVADIERAQARAFRNWILWGNPNGPTPEQQAAWDENRKREQDAYWEREIESIRRAVRMRFDVPRPMAIIEGVTAFS